MSDTKPTKLTLHGDRPTALASSAHGSNLDAIAFNITFLALRNPKLAIEIMTLYGKAHLVDADDPVAPEEDMVLFAEAVTDLLAHASSEDGL